MRMIDFFDYVESVATEIGSKYADYYPCRDQLWYFMESNAWLGILEGRPTWQETVVRRQPWLLPETTLHLLKPRLQLWLSAYQQSNQRKLEILAEFGAQFLPGTVAEFLNFVKEEELAHRQKAWRLLDFLLASLEQELPDCSDTELDQLAVRMDKELPLVIAQLFSKFLEYLCKTTAGNNWIYHFSQRSSMAEERIEAYSVRDYSVMAYCTFHEDSWKENHLIEKACLSPAYANLWAFVAIHFVCALRGTDIERLPLFGVPCGGEQLRRGILDGSFTNCAQFVQGLQIRLGCKPMKPQKTEGRGDIPEIKLFVPQSLEEPLGAILAIAASFHTDAMPGQGFIKKSTDITAIRQFFGNKFAAALNGKNFSSRRANKAYLQGLGGIFGESAPKGYMLAALARSHKGGIGSLPDTTEIYLRDAKFSGYSPEFIAREMFERGVLGFVPYLLLESYAGDAFKRLPIKAQTEMIKEIGISASGLERITQLSAQALLQARDAMSEVISEQTDLQTVLQRVASGNAPGKQDNFLCLMTAAGRTCCFPERGICLGCRYEIFTKAAMHTVVSEYNRLQILRKREADSWRCQMLLRQSILPLVAEILESARLLYPRADMDALTGIMEGGLAGYVSGGQSGS